MSGTQKIERRPAASAAGPDPNGLRKPSEGGVVVAIGASAGGLEACKRFLTAIPAGTGLAYMLVQHLDPQQQSLLVDLLAHHTSLKVEEAIEGGKVESGHLYVIPPGRFLAVENGAMRLSNPPVRQGPRLPFDFLLRSLATEKGSMAAAVVLSGTGSDGTIGIGKIKEMGGLVIAQDPKDAGFAGMPDSAIASGAVDLVLNVEAIPDAIARHFKAMKHAAGPGANDSNRVADVISVLKNAGNHDFSDYKLGTIERRIAQRMAAVGFRQDEGERYVEQLKGDPTEVTVLANELLINVTSFFRDPDVFKLLAEKTIPEMVSRCTTGHVLRVWAAGCSTGEEAYSLAMVFLEHLTSIPSNIRLQIFATDADPEAIAFAREGLYSDAIVATLPPDRLKRFFEHEESGYRVSAVLRACLVFSVHDLLTDPPFARIDFISCRNVLIYLSPEAQARIIAVFHFALSESGLLLLGSVETTGVGDEQFEIVARKERLWRRAGKKRTVPPQYAIKPSTQPAIAGSRDTQGLAKAQISLASLCQRLIVDHFAPAAVLVDAGHQCLYSLGPVERYLHVAPGYPSHDILAMIDNKLHGRILAALKLVGQTGEETRIAGGSFERNGGSVGYELALFPVDNAGDALTLICFIDSDIPRVTTSETAQVDSTAREEALANELNAARLELQSTVRRLELLAEDQKAVNEEAVSFNEEYQSANEELLTSKEELQSLNEELTALNGQLQETLERQRTTTDDLQNVLYSTDVATLFLDTKLNIRFFTPATKSLFKIIASDIGRPLEDLNSAADDDMLIAHARLVLVDGVTREREIRTREGVWYIRRISPYLAMEKDIEGVVITFSDITERKHIADALEEAKRQAQSADAAKSRFLAAASHDLRQPLQTLTLLHELLTQTADDDKVGNLVARFGKTLNAMAGMLNTLLDINQIEAGTIKVEILPVAVGALLDRMKEEFTLQAESSGLQLRLVKCSLVVQSDPSLLEQMLRNLLSNALKYTKTGKVLMGCRRRANAVAIEIWDTGIGIPDAEQQAIFEEFHQLDNPARERDRGLGLGLSIVKRLGKLLDHKVEVKSRAAKGSVFRIIVAGRQPSVEKSIPFSYPSKRTVELETQQRHPSILIIEDDSQVRELLEMILTGEQYVVRSAADGNVALGMIANGAVSPDLILADYNLPNGANGLAISRKIRSTLGGHVPVLILTGDISTATLQDISNADCVMLNKPVKVANLRTAILNALKESPSAEKSGQESKKVFSPSVDGMSTVYVVDDDADIRDMLSVVLEAAGYRVEAFTSCEDFLQSYPGKGQGCLLIDAYLPGMSGLDLLDRLKEDGDHLPAIMITGRSDVALAVDAMKAGACDFVVKPITQTNLLDIVERAMVQSGDETARNLWKHEAGDRISGLTQRQLQIMKMILAGHPNKNIAADLGISQRTVENHRASIMKRTGSKSLPALARLAIAAAE